MKIPYGSEWAVAAMRGYPWANLNKNGAAASLVSKEALAGIKDAHHVSEFCKVRSSKPHGFDRFCRDAIDRSGDVALEA